MFTFRPRPLLLFPLSLAAALSPPPHGLHLPWPQLPVAQSSSGGRGERSSQAMAAAEAQPLQPPPPGGVGAGTERALEEAAASGTLILAGRRLRSFPAAAARRWDISDTTQADLSRNRFGEVPEAACHLPALEGLSLHHNCLRSVPPAIANLQALAHLDLSRNHLSSLPPSLCLLPLRVLNASNNRLAQLPDNIGAMGALRQLDVSSNALRALPPGLGQLRALRDLNLRRNLLTVLPMELSGLPLVHLDFSCNRIVAIPRCYRRLRHLQSILTEHNPLQSPPAQICLKGKVHIFKYLETEAAATRAPPPAGPMEELSPPRHRHGLDSGFHSVDSGSKRWSGNESTEEFAERLPQGKRCGEWGSTPMTPITPLWDPPITPMGPPHHPYGIPPSPLWDPPPHPFLPHSHLDPGPPSEPRSTPVLTKAPRPPRVLLRSRLGNAQTPPPCAPPNAPPHFVTPISPTAPPDASEGELMAEMQQSIESLLQLRLGNEELLSRLTQRLRPPLAAQPLPPGLLAGFALFYGLVMALLYAGYRALFGC
ncbi:leucine-rich repeat and calponin homology domain-containing protein 4 [Neopsephotus bourkii]|uniref:leucine-rich repeat and calponin homology domain-containing protein 4 n=1 Tax=Neopsephotus bourkii TaxID=309878 RepID=UPI002AA5B23D|nr:leucine-rich repeat and calponin homology domain-containing protein 4 [Neopsephotus bourkii]